MPSPIIVDNDNGPEAMTAAVDEPEDESLENDEEGDDEEEAGTANDEGIDDAEDGNEGGDDEEAMMDQSACDDGASSEPSSPTVVNAKVSAGVEGVKMMLDKEKTFEEYITVLDYVYEEKITGKCAVMF